MKLLVITSIKMFEKEVKQMLKKSDIKIFSYTNITGFRDSTVESVESNWFASEMNETKSLMFYAFAEKDKTDILFNFVNEFNNIQKTKSNIHIVILNVEKSN